MNTDQKLPAESAGERPSTPLFGHAISHEATLIGLFAIVLWGFMAGLVRLVSESFGATLGSALIYTVGGMLLLIVRRPKPISQAPRKYLVAGGLMFIAYEASISLSIGLATTNAQSVEVSLVNYLWPTLLVLMTAAVSHKRGSVSEALPGAIVATVGVAMAVGGENLDVQEAVANIASNPLPYALACAASIAGGYACWGYGMLHGSMETLAIGSYATPLFSTASSTLLLGVTLGMPFWIGVALVVVGSLINVWFARRR